MNDFNDQSAAERLQTFLRQNFRSDALQTLTPDASTREYFRVKWNDATAIACVYPEAFVAAEHAYLDVTNLFLAAGLPVAHIYDFSESLGVIVQEDFGDSILRDVLNNSEAARRDDLINESINLIAQIQAATHKAFQLNSIASRLKFDAEKLFWELNFFKTHYFESLKNRTLNEADANRLEIEFLHIAQKLETHAEVLCHRDFHAANLMIDDNGALQIIDHQDARIGTTSYDLVSLLLDRILEPPTANQLEEKLKYFLNERVRHGLKVIDYENFKQDFNLQAIQRCLKAIGTFSFQTAIRGKTNYEQFIEPLFRVVLQTAQESNEFPELQRIVQAEI